MNVRTISERDQFNKWYSDGIKHGWIGGAYCDIHDGGAPMTDHEMDDLDEGRYVCITAARLYPPEDGDR